MDILGQQIELKNNLIKSLRSHQLLWILLVVTATFDFASTLFFMSARGVHVEQNLLVRWLATNIGVIPGVLIGKLLQLAAVATFSALSARLSRAVLLLVVLLNFFAIYVNLFKPAVVIVVG